MKTEKIKMYCPVCFRVWSVSEVSRKWPPSCVRCSFQTGQCDLIKLELTSFEKIKEKNVYKS